MSFKPFKRPSFKQDSERSAPTAPFQTSGNAKRRRLSPPDDKDETPLPQARSTTAETSTINRQPLKPIYNPPSPVKDVNEATGRRSFYSIVWRKVTAKKNKTWEDDGVLVCKNGYITAYNSRGHKLGSTVREKPLEVEDNISMSGKDIQIEAEIDFDTFSQTVGKHNSNPTTENVVIVHGQTSDSRNNTEKPAPKMSLQDQMRQQIQSKKSEAKVNKASGKTSLIPSSRNAAFRNPLKGNQVLPKTPSETPIPRHDPNAPNALVFRRPKRAPVGKQIVDVVLDPLLTKNLRDHQREGVKFLYECVMGFRDTGGNGCILADDMGLGKTLQTIALIWTLIKQNPVYKDDPVVKKVLIVCPVTLVQNWRREFRKWLGRDRLGVMAFDDEGSRLSMFDGRNFNVMIVGYERLQKIVEDLTRGAGVDLVICDEGHRLKSLKNKSAKAIEILNTPKRIILSGTPIQNDLTEFFAMVNFVNDGVLGSAKAFAKDFERPIMKSRQPNATESDIEKGLLASEELAQTTSTFILRRTAAILSEYLPPKTEYVLFCRPTPLQASIYRAVLATPMFKSALGSQEGALQMITILKKLCNSPSLLHPKLADESIKPTSLQTLNEMLPTEISRHFHNSNASKIRLLDELLLHIQQNTNDKVVLVSNYTATLDLMQNLLSALNMSFKRLDGSVSAGKRQTMVDEFNKSSKDACFAFLLSAKAGGVGINLIGGNRLILFDVDWNPATDDQAMARIHREGQKKHCYIYRFLIKGALEERIWQRQVVKRGLADSIMESGGGTSGPSKGKGKAAFSLEELRDLFRLDEHDGLRTHDLIECGCGGSSELTQDLAAGKHERIHDLSSDEDDDNDLVRTFSITRASQVNDQDLEDQEQSISRGNSPRKKPGSRKREQQKKDLQELMTYSHIDTSTASGLEGEKLEQLTETIGDQCLMNVLRQGRDVISGNIAYIFKRESKTSSLVEVDATNNLADGAEENTIGQKGIADFMTV